MEPLGKATRSYAQQRKRNVLPSGAMERLGKVWLVTAKETRWYDNVPQG